MYKSREPNLFKTEIEILSQNLVPDGEVMCIVSNYQDLGSSIQIDIEILTKNLIKSHIELVSLLDNDDFKLNENDVNNLKFMYGFTAQLDFNNAKKMFNNLVPSVFFAKFHKDDSAAVENVISGTIYFSNSPLKFEKVKMEIVFKNKLLDQMFKVCKKFIFNIMKKHTLKSESEVAKYLNFLDYEVFSSVEVLNVGEANFNLINTESDKTIFFDVGIDRFITHTAFQSDVTRVQLIKPSLVILSHLHIDHYLSCIYFGNNQFLSKWIAPTMNHYLPSIIRLFALIKTHKGQLKFVPVDLRGKVLYQSNNVNCILSMGYGRGGIKEKVNNSGLTVFVRNNKCALLTGDCIYSNINAQLTANALDFLVGAHHGSNTGINNTSCLLGTANATAIFSTRGINNHPGVNHITYLYSQGFTTLTTKSAGSFIFKL